MRFLVVQSGKQGLYDSRYENYRGAYRLSPNFIEALSTDHPANQAYYRYSDERVSSPYVSDLSSVRQLVDLYGEFAPSQPLEALELVAGTRESTIPSQLLGYDVVTKNLSWSFLANGMLNELSRIDLEMSASERLDMAIIATTSNYIRPRLNQNWLLHSFDEALISAECLNVLRESKEMGGVEAIAVFRLELDQMASNQVNRNASATGNPSTPISTAVAPTPPPTRT